MRRLRKLPKNYVPQPRNRTLFLVARSAISGVAKLFVSRRFRLPVFLLWLILPRGRLLQRERPRLSGPLPRSARALLPSVLRRTSPPSSLPWRALLSSLPVPVLSRPCRPLPSANAQTLL